MADGDMHVLASFGVGALIGKPQRVWGFAGDVLQWRVQFGLDCKILLESRLEGPVVPPASLSGVFTADSNVAGVP